MRNERSSYRSEQGASLIEALVAVILLGSVVVGVLGAMAASISTSDYHRKRSEVESVLVSAAERIKETPPVVCAKTSDGSADAYLAAARRAATAEGWSGSAVQITSITYWDGAAYGATCYDNATNKLPLQRITVEVTHPSGRARQQLELVKGELD